MIVIIVLLVQNSYSQEVDNLIYGNWYFYEEDSTQTDPHFIHYAEYFIKKDTMFKSYQSTGYLSPSEFLINGDSVHYSPGNHDSFKAKIEYSTIDSFCIKVPIEDTFKLEKFYRLKGHPNLEDYRHGKVSSFQWHQAFASRLNKLLILLGL